MAQTLTKKGQKKANLLLLDYETGTMLSLMRHSAHLTCTHMQKNTPYGEAYENAYRTFKKLGDLLDKLENDLLECAKATANTGEDK